MKGLVGQVKFVILLYTFATLFYSKEFVDATTFPKLMILSFSLLVLTAIVSRHSKSNQMLFALLLVWTSFLAAYLMKFGLSSLESILLGYPQRNLGLLSLLIFVLSFWIFYNLGTGNFLLTIRVIGLALSTLIIASHLPNNIFLFDQFVYPKPGALNSNVLSPILAFSLVAWLALSEVERRARVSLSFKFIRLLICLSLLSSTYLLGNLQSLLYSIYVLFAIVIFRFAPKTLRNICVIFPVVIGFVYVISVSIFADWLNSFGDASIRERLAFVKLFWNEITRNPFRFMAVDSSADLNLIDFYTPKAREIIDNAHNVWLEVGIHFGLVGLLTCIGAILYLMLKSSLRMTDLTISKAWFGFEENHAVVVLQQLAFVTLFFSILHPISVWIYGAIVGLSMKLISRDIVKESYFFFRKDSEVKKVDGLAVGALVTKKSEKLMNVFISLILISVSLFICSDIARKLQFRNIERELVNNQVPYEKGIEQLLELTIQLNDRAYLDYSGRRLMEAGRCEEVAQIIGEQKRLRFQDLNARLLVSTWRSSCRPDSTLSRGIQEER